MPKTIQILDTQRVRVSLDGLDAYGVKTGQIPECTVTLDQPDRASVAPDFDHPGDWIITPSAQTEPTDAPMVIVAQISNNASGQYDTVTIEVGATSQNSVAANAIIVVL